MQATQNTSQKNLDNVQEISAREIERLITGGKAVLIDVRERDEHERERIAGAMLMPLSTFDPENVLSKVGSGKTIVIHCRGGVRGAEATRKLCACAEAGTTILNMTGGIEGWKTSGLEVVANTAMCRVSILRQVQLIVGGGVLIGSTLAWFVHPGLVAIPALLGAGLTFAGATGTCALASVLGLMPWNRAATGKCAGASTCTP